MQADNVTMSAGGGYSLATIGAKHVIDLATPQVLKALESLIGSKTGPHQHWCFSDMGCADGGTSLDLWRRVIGCIRETQDNDVQIVYADQARNDFNALVKIVHGLTQFDTYLHEFSNITVMESGASFYTPILPKASLDLGFSATAMHWLSSTPCQLSSHIHMVGANGQERDVFAEQAAQDWQTILLHRAREMKFGSKLVLVNFCIDESGQYLGNTGGINMFDQFNANWQQFVEDGVISESEYLAMNLPQYYNTVDEFSAPLTDVRSEVYEAGLRLVEIQTGVVPCPFAEDFSSHGDAERFAKAYIPTIRSWNESVFAGGLNNSRSEEERREIIENYYDTYRQQVTSDPTGHAMDYVHAYMTIEKAG